ncbi:unnamed protein product [Sympodiomycopsis kandeliae]
MALSASPSSAGQRGDAADTSDASTSHKAVPISQRHRDHQPVQLSTSPLAGSSTPSASSTIPQRLNIQDIQASQMGPQFAASPTSDSEETSTPIALQNSNTSHHRPRWPRPHWHNDQHTSDQQHSSEISISSRQPHQLDRGWLSTRAHSYSSQQSEQSLPSPSSSRDDQAMSWTGLLKNIVGSGGSNQSDDAPTTAGTSSAGHSRHTSREYKETLDAHTKDEKDGTRIINQYHLVKVIGSGTYGVVYKCCLRDDPSQLFAAKEFSKTRLKKSKRHENLRRPALRGRGSSNPNAGGGLRGRGLGHTQYPGRNSEANSADHNPESSEDAEKDPLRLIRREIAIMKKLTHPNVISLIEALDDPSRDELYMILEFCPDGPVIDIKLHERTQPLNEETARSYFCQILLGIEYLHHNDIIHRDIKPDNILLCENRRTCKIVDFGVSEMFDHGANQDRLKGQGTPAFLSPELCSASSPKYNQGDPQSTAERNALKDERESNGRRDDMWALGVTLYCMVVGHLPFDKSHFMELYEAIREQEPEYPSHLTPRCVDLLKHFLNKEPDQRIDIEGARAHTWLTAEGQSSILPATENLKNAIHDITEDEIQSAIARISSVWTVARAVSKFKLAKARGSMRSASSQSQNSDTGSGYFDSTGQQSATAGSFLPDSQTPRDSPLQSPRIPMSAPVSGQDTTLEGRLSRDYSRINLEDSQQLSGSDCYKRLPRSQPLSRQASVNAPPSITESPEEQQESGQSGEGADNATISESVVKVASDVGERVATFAQSVVSESGDYLSPSTASPLQALNVIGSPSSTRTYGQSIVDALSTRLKGLESTFEGRMRLADPVAAKKHLANHLQQYPPPERLKQGLKGMGLDLFGWAEEAAKGVTKGEDKAETENEQEAAEEFKDSEQRAKDPEAEDPSQASPSHSRIGLSAVATDAANKLLGTNRGESGNQGFDNDASSQVPGSIQLDELKEDKQGRNVHTGRSKEAGQASSGATKDLEQNSHSQIWHRTTNNPNDGDFDDEPSNHAAIDETKRLFEGPLIESPHRENISRDIAARTLGGGDASPSEGRPDSRRPSDVTLLSRNDSTCEGHERSYGGNLSEDMKHEEIQSEDGGLDRGDAYSGGSATNAPGQKQGPAK